MWQGDDDYNVDNVDNDNDVDNVDNVGNVDDDNNVDNVDNHPHKYILKQISTWIIQLLN